MLTSRISTAAALVTALGVATARPAPATAEPDPATDGCVAAIERDGTALIFDLTWATERTHVAAEQRFVAVRAARAKLSAFETGEQVLACARTGAANRNLVSAWLKRFVRPALVHSRERLDEICTSQTWTILRVKEDVEQAMADNRLADAARDADALEYGLTHGAAVTDCRPMRARVTQVLEQFLPEVRATIALPKVTADLEQALVSVMEPWMAAQNALDTDGKTIDQAPALFTLAGGQQEFRARLNDCLHYAESLRSLGVSDDYPLRAPGAPANVGTNLGDAEMICRVIRDGADQLFGAVTAHNEAYEAEQIRKWEFTHIKGWDMWVVYNAHGRPSSTAAAPGETIEWTYRDDPTAGACTLYRFDARGKRLGKRRTRCTEPVAML